VERVIKEHDASLVDEETEEREEGVHVNDETGEVGGTRHKEPTRYGDWETNGRVVDF
jgi:hypothetical protein